MNKPKKILIVRTDRLGDVILSTPVIENLRKNFPKSYIAFMCRPYTKDALEGNPYLDEVLVYDKYDQHKNLGGTIEFVKMLRKKKFDWAIILHPTNRVHLVTFLATIPVRIGWNKDMSFLLTKKIPHTKQQGKKHEMEYTLDILKELDIPITSKKLYFPIQPQAEQKWQNPQVHAYCYCTQVKWTETPCHDRIGKAHGNLGDLTDDNRAGQFGHQACFLFVFIPFHNRRSVHHKDM